MMVSALGFGILALLSLAGIALCVTKGLPRESLWFALAAYFPISVGGFFVVLFFIFILAMESNDNVLFGAAIFLGSVFSMCVTVIATVSGVPMLLLPAAIGWGYAVVTVITVMIRRKHKTKGN
ncbi:MAG: hypothetical protein A2745_01490 [Candidatus Harrisonbacteria bacterium RIFCSPHIGHO2_01_FULL_44_13]|nr:MAG: hypothetical protein A2745_01490 [Candidatus Harrisonbacteria bacterium RIFCSPHIGHO2_01_FULL_44_13]